jgi:drug/metabolite transporter (DMT)-like permease
MCIMSKKLRSNLMLFLTAFIWGSAFVAQSKGMDYIGPYTFNCVRNIIASVFLLPVILLLDYMHSKKTQDENSIYKTDEEKRAERKIVTTGGILCGVILFVASSLQQIGIMYTTAGKAGFVTALYIVIVPILGIFLGKKVKPSVWGCVAIAAIGLYLLCIKEDFSIGKGDFLVLICAFIFSFHILVIDYYSPKTDGVRMSCIQFFVCFLLSGIMMLIFEAPELSLIIQSALPILYTGILSSGVAYTLQIVAQKDTDPTVASLLLSLESVFAVLAGIVVLHEMLSGREVVGCILMFVAIIVAQLPSKSDKAH